MRIKRMSERLKLYEDFLTEAEEEINQTNFTPEQTRVIDTFFDKNGKKIDFNKNKFLSVKQEVNTLSAVGDNDTKQIKDDVDRFIQQLTSPMDDPADPAKKLNLKLATFKDIIDALNSVKTNLVSVPINQDKKRENLLNQLEKPLKIMLANIEDVQKELSAISSKKYPLISDLTKTQSLKNYLNDLQADRFSFNEDRLDTLSDFIDYLDDYDTTSDKFILYKNALTDFRDILEKNKNLVTDISEEELKIMKSNALKACDEVIAAVNTYLEGTTKVNPADSTSENKLGANIKNFDNLLMQGEDEKAEKLAINFLNDIETNNFGVYTESFSLYEGLGETVKNILGNDFLGWIKAVKLGQLARTDNPFMNLILKNDDLWQNGFCRRRESDKNWFLKIYNWIITYKISGSGLEDFIANSKVIRAAEPLKQKQLLNLQDVQLNYMITQEYDYWKNNGNSLDKLDYDKLYQSALSLKKSRWGDFEQSDELERTIGDGGPVAYGTNTKTQVESSLTALAKNDPSTAAAVIAAVLQNDKISEKDLKKAFSNFTKEAREKVKGGLS